MADNFNLRSFLTENKLTKNAKLLNEANYSDSYNTPAAKAVNAKAGQIVSSIKGYKTALETIQDAIKQVEQEVGSEVTSSEKSTLEKHLMWMFRREMEMEREGVENDEPVMEEEDKKSEDDKKSEEDTNDDDDFILFPLDVSNNKYVDGGVWREKDKSTMKETKLTARERRLVEMVEDALGIAPQAVAEEAPIAEDEMANETVIPEYKNIEELLKSIEEGTNKVAEEHKIQEMKKIAEALRMKAKRMEESEHAAHISPKDLKQLATDAAKLEKAAEKLKSAFDKKFAAKKEKKEVK